MKPTCVIAMVALLLVASCSSQSPHTSTPSPQPTVEPTATPITGQSRSETWLIGTWEVRTSAKVTPSWGASKRIQIVMTDVALKKDIIVGVNTARTFAYSGSLVWDMDGLKETYRFDHQQWESSGTVRTSLIWQCLSQPSGQYMENIRLEMHGKSIDFELTTGMQTVQATGDLESLSLGGYLTDPSTTLDAVFNTSSEMLVFRKIK